MAVSEPTISGTQAVAQPTPAELLFQPIQRRALRPPSPDRHGAADPLALAPAGQRADRAQRLLLRAARLGRSHHQRGDPGLDAGTGLRLDAGHSQPRTGRGLAAGHRCGAQGRRFDLPAALARRPHLPSVPATRRHAAGRALGHQAQRAGVHRERKGRGGAGAVRHAAGACRSRRCRTSSGNTRAAQRTHWPRASTASRFTPPTATCPTSSSSPAPTSAPTHTAVRSRTGRGCCWKSSRRSASLGTGSRRCAPVSPGTFNDIGDDDPETTFGTIAAMLSGYGLAYLHVVNPALAALEKKTQPEPAALRMVDADACANTAERSSWPAASTTTRRRIGSAGQGGLDRLRPEVPGQPGSAGALSPARPSQCGRSVHLLRRRRQRVYRLPDPPPGTRRATETVRGREVAVRMGRRSIG